MSESSAPFLAPAVFYKDPKRALGWLEEAFGLEPSMVILGASGELIHSRMAFGESMVMIAAERAQTYRSPSSLGGEVTQLIHMQLASGIDEHCERARRAGAVIQQEPETQPYGDRTYQALDFEGHVWTFAQTIQPMTEAQWNTALGATTRKRL
jgi:uncharacterized glyoxalase superfamily protein PhnB